MVVVFKIRPWYAEEGLSRDELEDQAAEAPDIERLVDGPRKNQLGGPEGLVE